MSGDARWGVSYSQDEEYESTTLEPKITELREENRRLKIELEEMAIKSKYHNYENVLLWRMIKDKNVHHEWRHSITRLMDKAIAYLEELRGKN